MAEITAQLVKTLRERTQAPLMDCKKFLTQAEGDVDKAEELMRKSGAIKAAKKAGRVTAEGMVFVANNANDSYVVELNSETDFVARNEEFQQLGADIAAVALNNKLIDVETLKTKEISAGKTVADALAALIAKLGENIQLRRVASLPVNGKTYGNYIHGNRIAVLVTLEGGSEDLAKDIAMHIAASRPEFIKADDVPADFVKKEKEIFMAQAEKSGKPANIIEKMVEGKVSKYLSEISLYGQPFVKNPDETVAKLLKANNANVTNFVRFEVGEGIEKKQLDFAAEVEMAKAVR